MIPSFAHERGARRAALVVLTWTWCLPTTLVGLVAGVFARVFLGGTVEVLDGAAVVRTRWFRALGGVCLGPVIVVTDHADDALVRHEWGHFRQHLRLGPLYLLVIGVPSVTHALWHRLRRGTFPAYYHFWTEAWADALGGVYADHRHLHPRWTGYALGPAAALLATVLTTRAFLHTLSFPFTDADGLVDVAWAARPLSEQLLAPLTGGLGGANANFWRPGAMLWFWALRQLFGEWPAMWQLASLSLHVAASTLVGLLVEALAAEGPSKPRDRALALVATALFAGHPLAEEVVPATARSLDLLLGIGCFAALWALLRHLRGGPAAPFWAASLLAISAKEAGVLLLPVAAAWIGLYAPRARWLALARRLLLPLALGIAAFVGVRARVLGGLGGYREADTLGEPGLLGHALGRAFLEPLTPSFSRALAPLEGIAGAALTVGIWVVLAVTLRRERKLLLALAALYLPWVLLLGVTGTYSRRVLYVPVLATVVITAAAAREAWARRSLPAALVPAALLVAWGHGSPVFVRYDDWGISGRTALPLTTPTAWRAFPDDAVVWLVDRPSRVDVDPRRDRLWSKRRSLNNAAASYGIQAWVDEHVGRGIRVRNLSSIVVAAPVADAAAELEVDGPLRITRRHAGRVLNPDARVRAEVHEGVLTITSTAPVDAPEWLLVWDPERAVPVTLSALGARAFATAERLAPGSPLR